MLEDLTLQQEGEWFLSLLVGKTGRGCDRGVSCYQSVVWLFVLVQPSTGG